MAYGIPTLTKFSKLNIMGKNVNLCAKVAINTWANYSESNIWANRMPIYGQQHVQGRRAIPSISGWTFPNARKLQIHKSWYTHTIIISTTEIHKRLFRTFYAGSSSAAKVQSNREHLYSQHSSSMLLSTNWPLERALEAELYHSDTYL